MLKISFNQIKLNKTNQPVRGSRPLTPDPSRPHPHLPGEDNSTALFSSDSRPVAKPRSVNAGSGVDSQET